MLIRNVALIAAVAFVPAAAFAQTDYFNTDRGRPLQVQDAIPIERYAFELQAAPLRWSRTAERVPCGPWSPSWRTGSFRAPSSSSGCHCFTSRFIDRRRRVARIGRARAQRRDTRIPALAVSAGYSAPTGRSVHRTGTPPSDFSPLARTR
jgi:hypothetical protein